MKKTDKNMDNAKRIMDSIGMEKPSVDFTLVVMGRIAESKVPVNTTARYFYKSYYLLFIPLLVIVFFIPTVTDWLSKIKIDFSLLNFNSLGGYIDSIIINFRVTVSPTILSISIASLLLICLFAIINFNQAKHFAK
jgi:hypothetical protein